MECLRGIPAHVACTEYGDTAGLLLHTEQCDIPGDLATRDEWTSTDYIFTTATVVERLYKI